MRLCDGPAAYDGSVDEAVESRFTKDNEVSCYVTIGCIYKREHSSIQMNEV